MKTKQYKGYEGEYSFDEESGYWFGKVLTPKEHIILFESKEESKMQKEFENAVDDYYDLLEPETCTICNCDPCQCDEKYYDSRDKDIN